MGNMRTLGFQVPEKLFHKIKDYLQRNNMTQKDFVIGLIETEIERDLTQRAAADKGQTKSAAVSDCEDESEDIDEEQDESEEQNSGESDDSSEDESEELDDEESEDIDEDKDESEASVMSMSM